MQWDQHDSVRYSHINVKDKDSCILDKPINKIVESQSTYFQEENVEELPGTKKLVKHLDKVRSEKELKRPLTVNKKKEVVKEIKNV